MIFFLTSHNPHKPSPIPWRKSKKMGYDYYYWVVRYYSWVDEDGKKHESEKTVDHDGNYYDDHDVFDEDSYSFNDWEAKQLEKIANNYDRVLMKDGIACFPNIPLTEFLKTVPESCRNTVQVREVGYTESRR